MNELVDDMLDEGPLESDLEEFGDDGPKTAPCPVWGRCPIICARGSIVLPSVNTPDRVQSVLSVIEEELRSERARNVQNDGESIVFTAGVFRLVSSLNALGAITKGRISVHLEPNVIKLDYELWFTEMLIIVAAMSCFFGVFVLNCNPRAPGVAICTGLGAFTFFFGLNMLFARLMIKPFLKACVEHSASSMP